MPPFHQLPSPPPSEREGSISSTSRLCGNMPLDYAIETDVKPIVRDFRTGAVLDPGGAGDKYVVDRRGKRVRYEILPDDTPSPSPKRTRIKSEPAAYNRLDTADIKSEDENEGPNRILSIESQDPPRDRKGSSHRCFIQDKDPQRPRTPCPSTRVRDEQRHARDSPSDDDSSDGAGSSSSQDSSSDDDTSSDEPSSSSSTDGSLMDVSSVFRPSRSPSRFADTPSPTTRGRSRVKQGVDQRSDAPPTPSALSKGKPASQATSVPKPPSMSFYIPIRQTNCESRQSSHIPPCLPTPVHAESTVSPATSRAHGWNPINKKRKAANPSKSNDLRAGTKPDWSDARTIPTAPAAMLASASQHYRAATAGPSKGPHGPGPAQSPAVHSSQNSKQTRIAKTSSQSQASSAWRSPKGKEIAKTTIENITQEPFQDHHSQAGQPKLAEQVRDKDQIQSQVDRDNKRALKNKANWQKLKAKKKAKKLQKMKGQANISKRHGPPRQARIERSIEEIPGPGLPTPGPSSSTGKTNTPTPPGTSPARSESGMFVTSPIQRGTPGPPSSHQNLPASLTPFNSSPPTQKANKRSRSLHENAEEVGIRAMAQAAEGLQRTGREIEAGMRLMKERLEQKMEHERIERQRFEQSWEEQFSQTRREDRVERERFALGLEERLSRQMKDDEAERKRIGQAMADNEALTATLQGQLQSHGDRQRVRNDATVTHMENNTQKVRELQKHIDDLQRQQKANQDLVNDRLLRLEAATLPAGPANNTNQQAAPAQTQPSGARKPQIREVRPREAYDWPMRGRRPGVIPDTLIQSEHGKPNPRTLPPLPPRNLRNSGSALSRPAQPLAQNNNALNSGRSNQGAHRQNRTNDNDRAIDSDYSTARAQDRPQPLSAHPSPNTINTATEPYIQPTPFPGQGAFFQPLPETDTQPAPATPSSPTTSASTIEQPNSSLPRLPRLTYEEMKRRILNHPLSGLDLHIDYDKDTDGSQTTAATAFLLNAPQALVAARFRAFLNRPAFVLDLDDLAVRSKGCWAVAAGGGQQDTQFKLYYNDCNYAFTLNRQGS
ncbi:hypothetical protein N0V82_010320 [Gnomoniopsis sp. IMI 355080]|nr:hypothetical protein N0V82_010320 [Gnomoniopsis sp. IMI 355080]